MIGKLVAVVLCTTLYTLVRYVYFGGISPNNIPVYLLNKSVSIASAFFLFCTALNHAKNQTERVKFWSIAALHGTYLHIMLSLAILSKSYYPKFFGPEKMTFTGEMTILFGVLAVYCFWFVRSKKYVFYQRQIFQLLSGLFLMGHLIAMGFTGWSAVDTWHGGLPPISLIGFMLAALSFLLFLKTKHTSA